VGPDGALADAYATALVVSGVSGADWFSALPGWSAYVIEGDTATAWGPAFDDTARRQES
jgi:thiamine biosynthesis lipoprotein ApbE